MFNINVSRLPFSILLTMTPGAMFPVIMWQLDILQTDIFPFLCVFFLQDCPCLYSWPWPQTGLWSYLHCSGSLPFALSFPYIISYFWSSAVTRRTFEPAKLLFLYISASDSWLIDILRFVCYIYIFGIEMHLFASVSSRGRKGNDRCYHVGSGCFWSATGNTTTPIHQSRLSAVMSHIQTHTPHTVYILYEYSTVYHNMCIWTKAHSKWVHTQCTVGVHTYTNTHTSKSVHTVWMQYSIHAVCVYEQKCVSTHRHTV